MAPLPEILRQWNVCAKACLLFLASSMSWPFATAGLDLHGESETQQGIPECFNLAQELWKCQAGGPPPPASIPDEMERLRRAEAAKAATAEELAKAEQAKNEAEAAAKAEPEARKDTDDPDADLDGESAILPLATPLARSPAAG